jgi:hypothetical protein
MSILNELTTTATDAVATLKNKTAGVVIDVRKHVPAVPTKKVQSAVAGTVESARKRVVDVREMVEPAGKSLVSLTERGEKKVRDLTGMPAGKPVTNTVAKATDKVTAVAKPSKKATKPATKPASKPAAKATRKPAVRKTTATKPAVKKVETTVPTVGE